MIEKKKISYKVLLILLLPVLILSYYVSGIFIFDDISIFNVMQHLEEVFKQFYKPFLWFNDKTPLCLGVGVIVWIFICYYIVYNYRNFQFGKEYGNEDWADPEEVTKRRSNPDSGKNRILSYNVQIAREGQNAPSNNNMIVMGSSGTYKTTSVVTTNILQAESNFIILDVKGELMYKYGLYLQSQGYTIRSLNLKEPQKSDCYNPFEYFEKEEDIIRFIANIQSSINPPTAAPKDPFWDQGVALYLQSVFYYEWFMAEQEGRTGCFNNILKLVNDEAKRDATVKVPKGQQPPTILQEKMDALAEKYGDDNPAVRDYRKLKEGATETVRSIIIITNALLKLCETKEMKRIFEADDLKLREFATGVDGMVQNPTNRKLALFLCVDDQDTSFNFICSMVYTQAIQILCRMADEDFKYNGGALPIPLEMWLDEFYAGARPADTEKLMGVVRSRNISLIPILQSASQLKALFNTDKWEVIMDNCATLVFLGAGQGALETHKYISELLGKMTIDTHNDGKNGRNENNSFNRMGRELMTPGEVKRMDRKHCIILTEGEYPIYDYKALPWEMPGKGREKSPFNQALELNKKSIDGGYVVADRGMIDPHTGNYETIRSEAPYEELKEFPEGVDVIRFGKDFIYKNFNVKPPADMNSIQEQISREYKQFMMARSKTYK